MTTIGNSSPLVVDAVPREQVADFLPACFMVTPYGEYVAVAEHLNRLARAPAKAHGAVQLGGQAVENASSDRAVVHEEDRGGGLRPRLPRPHQRDDGADRQVDAITKSGFRPFARRSTARRCRIPYRDGLIDKGTGHQR